MPDDAAKAEAAMAGEEVEESVASSTRKRGQSLIEKEDKKKDGKDENRIMVYARLRPVFKRDREDPAFEHIVDLKPDRKTISLTGGKTYVFDGTFGEKSEQVPVWEAIGKPVVENVFKGYSGCMMAYGQTGTGKSHTMSNMEKGQEGIILQSMLYIFQKMENDAEREYHVEFGYLQIYLDKVNDLMKPTSGNLDIVRNDDGEVTIPGLMMQECNTREKFVELYEEGDQHRIVAATKMNPVSSRSHSCLVISIASRPKGDDGTGEKRNAKMWMIDLAGYERFSKTGVMEGIRKEEAKNINASLLSLGNVIQALAEKAQHVPWRNAKLTRLLQDAIGGKSKASVCITLGPSGVSFHETVGTLYFGSRAMAVKTDAKIVMNIDYAALCKKLEALLAEEQEKVNTLELAATTRQVEASEREDRMQREIQRLKTRHEEQLQKLIESGADAAAIQAMIQENQAEIDIVQEFHTEERRNDEEKVEEDIKVLVEEKEKVSHAEIDKINADHEAEVTDLRSQLETANEEVARLKKKEEECAQLNQYITNLKEEHNEEAMRMKEEGALKTGVSKDGLEQLKVEYDKQVNSIRTMMETTHESRILEMEETHETEMAKLRKQMETSSQKATDEYESMKRCYEQKLEDEVAKVKAKAADVQEKLKKNHTIIKNSYQEQKEKLKAEIKSLKAGHDDESQDIAARGQENLRNLAEQHTTIKKNYQEQLDRLKAENASLKAQLGKGTTANGTSAVEATPPPPAEPEAAAAAAAPEDADPDDE